MVAFRDNAANMLSSLVLYSRSWIYRGDRIDSMPLSRTTPVIRRGGAEQPGGDFRPQATRKRTHVCAAEYNSNIRVSPSIFPEIKRKEKYHVLHLESSDPQRLVEHYVFGI